MNASLKKFLGNKNTVTILGVLLCIVILVIGYNRTINSRIKLTFQIRKVFLIFYFLQKINKSI